MKLENELENELERLCIYRCRIGRHERRRDIEGVGRRGLEGEKDSVKQR